MREKVILMTDWNIFLVAVIVLTILATFVRMWTKIMDRLDTIAHDIQQVKTAQRASQKRERKILDKTSTKWEK